jgi:hypothetical protein
MYISKIVRIHFLLRNIEVLASVRQVREGTCSPFQSQFGYLIGTGASVRDITVIL